MSARTTNYARTIASLRGVLTGLFPDAAQQQQPIAVHTSDEIDEFLCEHWLQQQQRQEGEE